MVKIPLSPLSTLISFFQCNANVPPFIDFPGEGEDEIAFQKGEIIVVIAKDEGFGDGWWTVTTLLILLQSFHFVLFLSLSSFAFSCTLAAFHLGGWVAGGRSTRYAQLGTLHCTCIGLAGVSLGRNLLEARISHFYLSMTYRPKATDKSSGRV
jgi:SH3 domain